jgi:excisionase family DNA binding protein
MTSNVSFSGDFYTVAELATEWRVTQQHLYALIRRGRLPAHKIGERVIVDRSAAQLFLQRNATCTVAA